MKNAKLERKKPIKDEVFVSTKNVIHQSMKRVPRKYRDKVSSIINLNELMKKFMIDKGLIGKAGQIDKVTKQIEMIEEYAIEKISKSRITNAQVIMNPIREN